MGRKKSPPFDDVPGVPEAAWVSLMLKIPTVFEAIWQLKQEYIALTDQLTSRPERVRAQKKWVRSREAEALTAIIQLKFHYSESTIKSGDHIWRAMRIYKKHRTKILNKASEQNV